MFPGREQRQRLCISYHVIVILKFYQLLFGCLGLVRLKFERSTQSYRLASGSNTIAKFVGAIFLLWTLVLLYLCVLHIEDLCNLIICITILMLSLNQSVYFLQRKSAMLRDVDVLNRFVRMVWRLRRLTGRQTKLSWLLLLQVLLKFGTVVNLMYHFTLSSHERRNVLFYYVKLAVAMSLLFKELPNHIFFIAISVLEKSYAQLNLELKIANITLKQTLRMHDPTAKARLNRKIYALRRLYAELGKLSQDFMCGIQLNLFLTCLYDVFMLVLLLLFKHKHQVQQQNWWSGWLTGLACLNNLRFLCTALESITHCAHYPFNVYDRDLSFLTDCEFGCCLSLILAQTTLAMNTATSAQHDADQRYLAYKDYFLPLLTQPVFTFFGVVTLNKRLFFKILFSYCSLVYMFHATKS